jgi:hypothetical protein
MRLKLVLFLYRLFYVRISTSDMIITKNYTTF